MRKTIPALKHSLVHFESNLDVSLALCSAKEQPEEQTGGKDNKNKVGGRRGGENNTVGKKKKKVTLLQFCN